MPMETVSLILRDVIMTTLLTAAPLIGASLVVGLIVSVIQTATSINEQTLTFIPKIIVVFGLFGMIFPWWIGQVIAFGQRMMATIATLGGS